MKVTPFATALFSAILCLIPRVNLADELAKFVVSSVTATNGLEMGAIPAKATNTTGQEIWLTFRIPQTHLVLYEPKAEYLGRITLYDSNNRPVAKTKLGATYNLSEELRLDSHYMRPLGHGVSMNFGVTNDWSNSFIKIPAVTQLFKIEKPGTYRLVMEIQCFVNEVGRRGVVRFPPLEIPLVQPNQKPQHTQSRTNASVEK